MARLTFLPSDDAYVRSYSGEPQAGIPVTVWTRQVGGTQVTDLVAVGYDGTLGAAITGGVLVSNSDGLLPAFAGPDGGTAVLWGSHGVSGERLALYSVSGGGGGGGTPTDGSVTLAKLAADTSAAVGGTTTATKTANYTAVPGETVPVDATSGPITVTLPAASRARDRVVVKKVDSTANAVTIARAGSDVINTSATTLTLVLQFQSTVLRSTGAGVWIVEAGDLPYGALTTALTGTFAQKWQAATAYSVGDLVVNPQGQTVQAVTAHTSGGSYSGTNWVTANAYGDIGISSFTLAPGAADNTSALTAAIASANTVAADRRSVNLEGRSLATTGLTLNDFTKLRNGTIKRLSGTAPILSMPSQGSLQAADKSYLERLILNGDTRTSGNVGISIPNHAAAVLRDVAVYDEGTGIRIRGAQFCDFYSTKAFNCRVGFDLANITVTGGGSSNYFASPQAVNNEVGMLLKNADTTFPMHSIEVISPQILSNSLCGIAAFGINHLNIRGWAGESNGTGGAATGTYNGDTVKRSSMHFSSSGVLIDGGHFSETGVTPCIVLENGSHLTLRDVAGYGVPSGSLVVADATSGVDLEGTYRCVGSVEGVRHINIDNRSAEGSIAGPPAIRVVSDLDNTIQSSQRPGFDDTAGAVSVATGTDSTFGAYDAVTFSSGGTAGRAIKTMNLSGHSLVAVNVQASVDTLVQIGLNPNTGNKRMTLRAGEWTRIFWWFARGTDTGVQGLKFEPVDTAGATIKFCKWQLITAATDDRPLRRQWNAVLNGCYKANADAITNAVREGATSLLTPVTDRSASMGGPGGGTGGLSNGTNTGANAFLTHAVIRNAYAPRLIYANYRGPDDNPISPNAITVSAAVKYGIQTYPLYVNGQRPFVIQPGQYVVTDPIPVDLVAGQTIQSRTYVSVASGEKWPVGVSTRGGTECFEQGTSITDKSLTGSVSANSGSQAYGPTAITGTPPAGEKAPTVIIGGDSIAFGIGTTYDLPYMLQALNNRFGYYQIACNGETALAFTQPKSTSVRAILLQHGTHAIWDYGINDLASRTTAQLQADCITVWTRAAWRGVKNYHCTLLPFGSSTDSWATAGNQTPDATREPRRVAFNDWLRDGAPVTSASNLTAVAVGTVGALRAGFLGHPLAGYFEAADRAETVRNSGIWLTNGTANYPTVDGAHPTTTMAGIIASGIDTSRITL